MNGRGQRAKVERKSEYYFGDFEVLDEKDTKPAAPPPAPSPAPVKTDAELVEEQITATLAQLGRGMYAALHLKADRAHSVRTATVCVTASLWLDRISPRAVQHGAESHRTKAVETLTFRSLKNLRDFLSEDNEEYTVKSNAANERATVICDDASPVVVRFSFGGTLYASIRFSFSLANAEGHAVV